MKQMEEAVEKVLAGLGGVEAPAGLEGRVLRGARARVEGRRVRAPWRWWGLAAGVCVVALVGVGVRAGWHREGHALPGAEVARARGAGAEATISRPPAGLPRGEPVGLAGVRVRRRVETAVLHHGVEEDRVATEDRVAVEEMLAPSLVAPPLALTEQEKLLLRVVHQGDAEELALLNPEIRLRQDAEGAGEVRRFFDSAGTRTFQEP